MEFFLYDLINRGVVAVILGLLAGLGYIAFKFNAKFLFDTAPLVFRVLLYAVIGIVVVFSILGVVLVAYGLSLWDSERGTFVVWALVVSGAIGGVLIGIFWELDRKSE